MNYVTGMDCLILNPATCSTSTSRTCNRRRDAQMDHRSRLFRRQGALNKFDGHFSVAPVIGGASYRHVRLRPISGVPAGTFVFPTAEQAMNSVCCRN